MKNIKRIVKEDFEEWFESIPSYDMNPNILEGALFLVDRKQATLSHDILVRIDRIFDRWGDSNEDPDSIRVGFSTFNEANLGKWQLPSDVELSWANHLIETGYWVPITKESADEAFQNYNMYHTLKESSDDGLGWAEDIEIEKAVVTEPGSYYPTNTFAMEVLEVTGFKDFVNKYSLYYWNGLDYQQWVEHGKLKPLNQTLSIEQSDPMLSFLREKLPILVTPEIGDECYIMSGPIKMHGVNLYKL